MPFLHERRIYLNKRNTANQFYTIICENDINFIVCLSIDFNKFYIYTETGLLVDAISYED